jgi:hypothetical protein
MSGLLAVGAMVALALPCLAQTGSVTGLVTRCEDGELGPIGFAVVRVADTRLVAETDDSGFFVMGDVPVGNQTLVGSAIGYGTGAVNVEVQDSASVHVTIIVGSEYEVDIDPPDVSLGVGETLSLTAIVTCAEGSPQPHEPALWDISDSEVASVSGQGQVTGVTVGTSTVSAQVGGATGSASVSVVDESEVAVDSLFADHTAGNPETVALVDGRYQDGSCSVDNVIEFLDKLELGNLTGDCDPIQAEAAVLSVDRATAVFPEPWSISADDVDATALSTPLSVPVAMWIALPEPTDEEVELAESELAVVTNEIFKSSRTGVQFTLVGQSAQVIEAIDLVELDSDDDATCEGLDLADLFQPLDPSNPSLPDTSLNLLNVVYVTSISNGGDPLKGYSCVATDNRSGQLVFVSSLDNSGNGTLAHELGHTMSLLFPFDGHTHWLQDFAANNVMNYMEDEVRDRFSLGQGYRMNLDSHSWLNHARQNPFTSTAAAVRSGGPVKLCQCDPYSVNPCPRLSLDVPSEDTYVAEGDWNPKSCNDIVRLEGSALDGVQNAAGLLSGRLWQTDQCAAYMPGTPDLWYSQERELLFPNLAASGSCDSRLVLFFDDHAVKHIDLNAEDEPWSYGAYELLSIEVADDETCDTEECIVSNYDALRPISVNLYWKAGLEQTAKADFDAVSQWFKDLYTGIDLQLGSTGLAPDGSGVNFCDPPLSADLGTAINVYYVAESEAGNFGDHRGYSSCTGTGAEIGKYVVTVVSGTASAKALAHHLGHVFGLSDVVPGSSLGDLSEATSNVMWHKPADPANSAQFQLTLGQIFRMNFHIGSWIQESMQDPNAVDCDASGAGAAFRCPPIVADGPRSPEQTP